MPKSFLYLKIACFFVLLIGSVTTSQLLAQPEALYPHLGYEQEFAEPDPLVEVDTGRFETVMIQAGSDKNTGPLANDRPALPTDALKSLRKNDADAVPFARPGETKSIPQCIARAVETSLPLHIAVTEQELARRRVSVALRELFPELDLEYVRSEGSNNSAAFWQGDNWRFNSRQPIFRGGELMNTLREEKEKWKSRLKEYDKILNDIIFDVSKAYISLFRAEQVLAERKLVFQDAEIWRTMSEQKGTAELISEIERLNVESIYHEQLAQLEIALQDIHLARLDLSRLLSLELSAHIEVDPLYDKDKLTASEEFVRRLLDDPAVHDMHEAEKTLNDYLELAYEHRPELELNVYRLKANQYAERAARGGLWPVVDIVAEVGQLYEVSHHIDPERRFGDFDEEKEYRFGLEVDWNLGGSTFSYDQIETKNAPNVTSFTGGGKGASLHETTFSLAVLDNLDHFVDLKQAEVDTQQSLDDLEEAEKQVVEDVERSYYDYQKARVELVSLIRRLDHRERLNKLSEIRLEKNEIQISEFLQSRVDLAEDRIQFHRSIADYLTARAGLNRAVGIADLVDVGDLHE